MSRTPSVPRRRLAACLLGLTVFLPFVGAEPPIPPEELSELRQWTEKLADDSYATRNLAAARLQQLARQRPECQAALQRLLQRSAAQTDDLELQIASRHLLARLRLRAQQRRLDRFLHDESFDRSELPGWERFSRHAGGGLSSRLVFAQILQQKPRWAAALASQASDRLSMPDRWELETLPRDDTATWATILALACWRNTTESDHHGGYDSEGTLRLTSALRCAATGPMPRRDHEQEVVRELIKSFLHCGAVDTADRIVIALRYGCRRSAEMVCRKVLQDPRETPAHLVTALLAASALDFAPAELDRWLQRYRNDARVSHVWRSMAPPKSTRRTQIGDVALAVQLHRAGRDPRDHGFDALVADPVLVFRPYSLGFETTAERRRAHAAAPPPAAAETDRLRPEVPVESSATVDVHAPASARR